MAALHRLFARRRLDLQNAGQPIRRIDQLSEAIDRRGVMDALIFVGGIQSAEADQPLYVSLLVFLSFQPPRCGRTMP